jgi:hypothetical protein
VSVRAHASVLIIRAPSVRFAKIRRLPTRRST